MFTYRLPKVLLALLINISLVLPTHLAAIPFFSTKKTQKDEKAENQKKIEKFFKKIKRRAENQQVALQVLNSEQNQYHTIESIVTAIELEELQFGRLVNKFNQNTETIFGIAGLVWLLQPVANEQTIKQRQTIIKSLTQDQKLFNDLQHALQEVKKSEEAVLNYWKENYKLHDHVKALFDYRGKGDIAKFCNKQQSLLEISSWFVLSDALTSIAQLSLMGVINQVSNQLTNSFWLGSSTKNISLGFILDNLKQTWYSPFRLVDPFPYIFNETRTPDEKYFKDIRTLKVTRNYNEQRNPENMPNVNEENRPNQVPVWGPKDEEELQRRRMILLNYGSLGDKLKYIKDCYFNGEYRASAAGVTAIMYSLGHVYLQYRFMRGAYDYLKKVYKKSQQLHIEMTDVARLIRSLEKLQKLITASPVLRSCNVEEHFNNVINKEHQSKNMRKLCELLKSSTFNEPNTLLHRRGRVLEAHKLLKKTKKEIVHVLQAVAEFDAYLALAKIVKEHKNKDNKYSFVTFVNQDTPMIAATKCWLPLIGSSEAVFNNIHYGTNNVSTKAVITGPNGGGKSTYLKSLGHAVLLGQSVGIIAADNATMTMFDGVRTSLAPKEDLSRGISTFMAQKERIKIIEDYVTYNSDDKCLVMFDEPYSGTTDDEAANRIWHLGKRIAQMPHCIGLIATHVKKPIDLAQDTHGVFANLQVEIDELKPGQFKRTFKVKPGAAMWWFDDAGRRSRFVDWLDEEIKQQAQKNQPIRMQMTA